MSEAEIARLRARAAQAQAEAAAAAARAAEAELQAALAAASEDGGETEAGDQPDQPDQSAKEASPAAVAEEGEATESDDSPAADEPPAETDKAGAKQAESADADEAPESTKAPAPAEKEEDENFLRLGSLIVEGEVTHEPVGLDLSMMNRHGLIAGATGTGKTRSLQLLAERLATAGVPVFLTDVKGDLSGIAEAGSESEKLLARVEAQGQDWHGQAFATEYFSLGDGPGIPIRTSLTDFGPLLLSRVLELNDTQEAALALIFHWADQQQLALIDLSDITAALDYLTGDTGKEELKEIGGIAPATAGVIRRQLAVLEAEGGDQFFGEPSFSPTDFLNFSGDKGLISLLELESCQRRPRLFSTFVLWLATELFETLDEVGDEGKPRLVFIFDEAHLLFDGASKAFLEAIIRTARLIRSRGVGLVFVTQNAADIDEDVRDQLGFKAQHAVRAHSPKDQRELKQLIATFPLTELDLAEVLPGLGTGQALITGLDRKGRPTDVAPTQIWAPASVMGPAKDATLERIMKASKFASYRERVDPESAAELLAARMAAEEAERQAREAAEAEAKREAEEAKQRAKEAEKARKEAEKLAERAERARQKEAERAARRREGTVDTLLRSASRTLGREITRTIFGTRRRR